MLAVRFCIHLAESLPSKCEALLDLLMLWQQWIVPVYLSNWQLKSQDFWKDKFVNRKCWCNQTISRSCSCMQVVEQWSWHLPLFWCTFSSFSGAFVTFHTIELQLVLLYTWTPCTFADLDYMLRLHSVQCTGTCRAPLSSVVVTHGCLWLSALSKRDKMQPKDESEFCRIMLMKSMLSPTLENCLY